MLRKRRILSYCLAFMMVLTVFRGSSILAEAATVGKSFDITYNSGNYSIPTITVNEGDTINVTLNIENQSGKTISSVSSYTYNVTAGTFPNIDDGNTGTWTFSIVAAKTQAGIAVMDGGVVDGNITFSIEYNTTPPSGGGDSSSDTSSKTSTSDTSSETSTTVSHTHSYAWEDVKEATEDDNGEMIYKCSCGEVLYRVPTSAYNVFNRNTAEKIKNAKQGATVKIETSRWISFHKMVMQALADRPDVSLEVSFLDGEYKGNRVSFTIPAGTDTLSLLDENGFSGFLYLAGKFGTAN